MQITPTESWNRDMSRSWANLINANDLHALSGALRRMQPLTFTRKLEDTEITVSVLTAPPVWPVAMVIQVKVNEHGAEWVQTFESVEKEVEILG